MADPTLMTAPDTLAECQRYCEELKAEVRRLCEELAANAAMLAKQCDLAREAETRAEQAERQRAEAAHGWLQQAARDALVIKQAERERDEARDRLALYEAERSSWCEAVGVAFAALGLEERVRADEAERDVLRLEADLAEVIRAHDEAEARVAALEAALRPFSAAADAMDDTTGPRQGDFAIWHRTGLCEAQITVGDCRRARAALRGEETP